MTVLEPGLKSLWQGLALLYQQVGAHERTIDILVQLHDPNVFGVFEQNPIEGHDSRLVDVLRERVSFFMELDYARALPILLDNIDLVTVSCQISLQCSKSKESITDASFFVVAGAGPFCTHAVGSAINLSVY